MNRIPDDTRLSLAIEPVPPRSGPAMFILRLKGSEALTFHCFSRAPFGIWVHYDQIANRSEPHYTDAGECAGCLHQKPKRWKGFLHCWCVEKKQQVFLELTPASANALIGQQAVGETLRGKGIFVQRTKGKNGRLHVRILPGTIDPATMPEEVDPLPSIMALWGIHPQASGGRELPIPSLNGTSKRRECL